MTITPPIRRITEADTAAIEAAAQRFCERHGGQVCAGETALHALRTTTEFEAEYAARNPGCARASAVCGRPVSAAPSSCPCAQASPWDGHVGRTDRVA